VGVCPFDVDSNATVLRVCLAAELGALSLHAAAGVVVEAGACRAEAAGESWWYPDALAPAGVGGLAVARARAVTLWGTSAALCASLAAVVYTPPLEWYAAPLLGGAAGSATGVEGR
jgi:hypothetical protein